MRLDVRQSPELTAFIQGLAVMPKEVNAQIRAHSKGVIVPEWKKGLAERAPARIFFDRLVNTGTAYVSDRNVRLVAGSDRAKGFPRETEFGAYREDYTSYVRRSRKGGSHKVTRRTQRQFWHYKKGGWVVYPTVSDMIPRIASLWVQTGLRTIGDLIDGK